MTEKDIKLLQKIFGEDRVFVINDKLSISKLPKLNLVLKDDKKENKCRTQ